MKVHIIKLGGSLITDKSQPFTLNESALLNALAQIADFRKQFPNERVILTHGSGSFAHFTAQKAGLKGREAGSDPMNIAFVADAAEILNRIVVKEALTQNIPAISIHPSSIVASENDKVQAFFLDTLLLSLDKGLVPVLYGDMILDVTLNGIIYSTENIIERVLLHSHLDVATVIHCGNVNGVMNDDELIEKITPSNSQKIAEFLKDTEGFDVTGGMHHKIASSLEIAITGIDVWVINPLQGNLLKALKGDSPTGTLITNG